MHTMRLVFYSTLLTAASMIGCVGASQGPHGVPTTTSVSPSSAVAGSGKTAITVSGINFNDSATVLVNGKARATTYLNNSQLMSILTSADLAQPKSLQISVAVSNVDPTNKSTSVAQAKDSVNFTVAAAMLKILTTSIPTAMVQVPYAAALDVRGGIAPYAWKMVSGRLPAGLRLASTGVISGTPIQTGQSNFTVQVAGTSSTGLAALDLSFSVLPRPTTPVPSPTPSPVPSPTPPPTPKPTPSPVTPPAALAAELPRLYIDTSMPHQTGLVMNVPVGGDFQGALNGASCGDTIQLAAGATYLGNFKLPVKSCDGWVVIRTSAPDSSLPPAGARTTPMYSHVLPKIVSPNSAPAIDGELGANHYRFLALEVTTTFSTLDSEQYGLVDLGRYPTTGRFAASVSELPHHIIIDRCYIHGTPKGNVKRGVAFNGAFLAVIDSYISDIHVEGQDTQTIAGWNGPGPFKIVDNELEAAGENIMFGGAQPALVNNIPSDIEIRGNHFFKPLSWMVASPSYAGRHWAVKNLLELKNAQRVLITGNILENNWGDGQTGFAFLISPRTELGAAPWIFVQDITFTYNVLRHTASGIKISGIDDGDPQKLVRGRRILIENNLFNDIDGKAWGGGDGKLFQMLTGADAVTIDHNTGFQSNQIITVDGNPNTNFVFQNNIVPHNMYGIKGSGYSSGTAVLNYYFPGFVFEKNVIVSIAASGVPQSSYPVSTFFPLSWAAVQFVNFANGNYALAASSPYKNAGTDGKDIGADIAGLNAATASAIVH